MAMYYYASKLNEASCSGCNVKVPSAPSEAAPAPPAEHSQLLKTDSTLLGTGLSYYDNDDYYSMVRGNKFMSESGVKHLMMNGGLNFVATQKSDQPQLSNLPAKSLSLPYVNTEKLDLEYKDGQIVSGTIDSLADLLRPGASKSFIFTFLLCSRLFIKPHELLAKLCKRYFRSYDKVGKSEMKDSAEKEVLEMVALVRVLDNWTGMFPYDFRDDRVMALVKSITQRYCRCSAEHMSSVRADMSSVLERLLDKLTALEHYEETLADVPQVLNVDNLPQGDVLTLGLTPVELANQLTMLELHRLSFIGPEEFVQTFVPNQPSSSGKPISLQHVETKSTKNLEAYAEWFNRLSFLVATDIVKPVKSKYRARVIEQWVMTARECFNLGNFNSLMAIISALNMIPVTRLRKTWSRTSGVCVQQLRQLELCVEPSGNHARYRAALAAAPTETAVPLLSVTCRDLHFVNQASPNKLGNRINFSKCTLLARHVCSQLAARRLCAEGTVVMATPPPLNAAARAFLTERSTLTERGLELTSFDREHPTDHLEKERFKRLRGGT
ncbi:ras-GEF domain-containing family member 1B isoform X1 [Pieris rapae]|uniref:ras-GEF domain-containing family member 1B isoform X1 n=1 Tax=Pieris rapae TaxID=64459 RepID=UPI001E27C3D9|nr:ras-GEF domain-containing family member 1B isoform X1 [Pieris rapae]XP_045490194.1 ras-GEF domain-containing family member 1B isoform X1 [Pieris rapae]